MTVIYTATDTDRNGTDDPFSNNGVPDFFWGSAAGGPAGFSPDTFSPGSTIGGLEAVTAALTASAVSSATTKVTASSTTTTATATNSIAADIAKYEQNGALSYSSVLTILTDAAAGGMTASKFASLQAFANELNAAKNGIAVSAYVQQIADDVILGNSANTYWNGGASTASALGNLGASSTQTQANELIGKWFLGTDLPSLSVSAIGEQNLNASYQLSTLPLYGSSGSPSYKDVNQGYLGDCYFLSALGDVALQDPTLIKSMITSNGNGTDSVRFFVNGKADYVTVNEALPIMSNAQWANGARQEFANGTTDNWVALVEKAYAELNEQTAAPHGMYLNQASDSYQGLDAGTGAALTLITSQSETGYALNSKMTSASLTSLLGTVSKAFSAGEEVLMSTPSTTSGNLVGGHMYMVTAINGTSGSFSIQNPWGSAYSGSLAMSFTETISQLAADNCALYVTSGSHIA